MNNKKMLDFQTIAVDFDGTLCYSKWPELGQPNQALIEYLQEWKRNDNLPEIIEFYGHNSRKISCDYYIDDRMLLPENAKAYLIITRTLLYSNFSATYFLLCPEIIL